MIMIIVKHPCMVVGQPVVPTLVHSSCDPEMVGIENYDGDGDGDV